MSENKNANPGAVRVKLLRPIKVNGAEVDEVFLNLEAVSGADLMNIETEMLSTGVVAMKNAAFSATYCMYVAARAGGFTVEDIRDMGARDVSRIVQEVQNFMLVSAYTESRPSGVSPCC